VQRHTQAVILKLKMRSCTVHSSHHGPVFEATLGPTAVLGHARGTQPLKDSNAAGVDAGSLLFAPHNDFGALYVLPGPKLAVRSLSAVQTGSTSRSCCDVLMCTSSWLHCQHCSRVCSSSSSSSSDRLGNISSGTYEQFASPARHLRLFCVVLNLNMNVLCRP
jgi:hypothetical protein